MPKLLHHPTAKFYLHSKDRERTSIILSSVIPYKGKMTRFKYHPGLTIETRYWDIRKQRPKLIGKLYDYLSHLNEEIKNLDTYFTEILKEHNYQISPQKLRKELDLRRGFSTKTSTREPATVVIPTLLQFLDMYLDERKQSASFKLGTWKFLNTWVTHLKDFLHIPECLTPGFRRFDPHVDKYVRTGG